MKISSFWYFNYYMLYRCFKLIMTIIFLKIILKTIIYNNIKDWRWHTLSSSFILSFNQKNANEDRH